MQKRIRHLSRRLAVATASLSLISYLPLPSGMGRGLALATAAAASPAIALPALQGEAAVQQLKEQGLYDSLSEALTATRYKVSWEQQPALSGLPPAYRAANPAQRFAAYFTPGELHLAPLAAEPEAGSEGPASAPTAWRGGMRLAGYGYGEQLLPVGAVAELVAQENRIEYRRPATPLTEWYINKAEGLEQGFDIAEPPGARLEGARLRLALELEGDLRAELIEAGEAIALRHVNAKMALRYGEMHAYDANEQVLSSRLTVEGGRVILEVEDAGAAYPVRIDPLITQQQKLMATDGGPDGRQFASSVAISGVTAVVGRYNDEYGSAYVFVRNGTTWSLQQKLTPGDAQVYFFGHSVAISGETVVVGTTGDTIGPNIGSAYVFVRNGMTWSLQQKLTASDGAAMDSFGVSVAVSGNTAVVGAAFDDIGANINQGSAYVFVRSSATWSLQEKLTASDGAADDWFGHSVAISGETVIVGAERDYPSTVANQQGSAYVFVRSGAAWSQQQKLTAGNGEAEHFGRSVAISGDTAVVGAHYGDLGANINQGAAYVFVRSGAAWSQQQKLTASDGATADYFGTSVAISGETVIVGAFTDDVGANIEQGSAYVFVRSGSSWSEQQKLTASDGAANDVFGYSVAISGDTAVVGAPRIWNPGPSAAYVFSTWGEQQKLSAPDWAANDLFGLSVAVSGDTAVVGAYHDDIGANPNQGSSYVFVRSGTTWSFQQKLTASDGAAGDSFGISAAISVDTIVVGASSDNIGADSNQGSAYVFVRSGAAWSQEKKLTAREGAADDWFGFSVAISGETAIVGSPYDDIGANSAQGSAYVFVRDGTTWGQQHKLTGSTGAATDRFGWAVAIYGNTVVVGAPYGDKVYTDQGAAYVFVGK